jgi:hypothetical protein
MLLSFFRKHTRLVDGLKGVDTEEVEDGFDEVHFSKFIEKEFSYIIIIIDFLALFFCPIGTFVSKIRHQTVRIWEAQKIQTRQILIRNINIIIALLPETTLTPSCKSYFEKAQLELG